MTVKSTIPDNGAASVKWAILQVHQVPPNKHYFGATVFLSPVHHGLAASYMQDIRKEYKGPGIFMMVEVKEIVEVTEEEKDTI